MNIEIERTPGFSNADGNVSYNSANEAFMAYLNATGQKPTKQNKGQFKAWLTKAKESGKLDQLIQGSKARLGSIAQQEIDKEKEKLRDRLTNKGPETSQEVIADDQPAKATKIMGMPPMVAVGVIVAVVGLVSFGVYMAVKKSKKAGA